jgi:hypothetical protein
MAKRSRFSNGVVINNARPTSPSNPAGETALLSLFKVDATFDPGSVAAQTAEEETATVTGVAVGDIVLSVTKPTVTAGVSIGSARVSATNTVLVTFINASTAAVDPASETYNFVIGRFGTT